MLPSSIKWLLCGLSACSAPFLAPGRLRAVQLEIQSSVFIKFLGWGSITVGFNRYVEKVMAV